MLTLTGAGGCGKTRLALEVARNLEGRFPDGIWWVALAPIDDPVLVPARVASVLDVREAPGRPAGIAIVDHLRSRRALVVSDNCEHVSNACAELCSTVLAACPDVSLLATSRELSVFAGGFDIDAAETVCGYEPLEREQVLGLLVRLVDRSLLELQPDGRYRLLETIRQFTTARLAPADVAAGRDRHLEHFVQFAEAARDDLEGRGLEQALTAVERDLDNIRAAMEHAVAGGSEAMALRIAGALWLFWLVRGRWREVQRRVELAFTATSAPAAVRATALVAGANVSLYARDFPSARRFSEEAVRLCRASGDRATLARALTWRGWAGVLLHPNEAEPYCAEAVSLCRHTGDDLYLVRALNGLGNVAALSESATAGRKHMREAIDVARRTGNAVGLGHALTNSGIWVSVLGGAFHEATEQLTEAFELARARRDRLFTTLTLYGLGLVATFRGEGLAHLVLRDMSETGDLPGVADALEGLAGFAAEEESFHEAARLLGASDAVRSAVGCVPFSPERDARERDDAAVRAALGEAFDGAVADGRRLTAEEAVTYAARGRGERRRPSTGWASLTPAERQVAALVAGGLTNPQIGEQLFVSRRTVQTHLSHIFAKLGVSTRAELAARHAGPFRGWPGEPRHLLGCDRGVDRRGDPQRPRRDPGPSRR